MPGDIEIDFLFSKLKSVTKDSLVSKNYIITKNSLIRLKESYDKKIRNAYENKDSKRNELEIRSKIGLVTPETLAKLFKDKIIPDDTSTLHKLAAFVLYLDKKISYDECIKQILAEGSWDNFIETYKSEYLSFSLKETFLLYYWKKGRIYIAQVVFELNTAKREWTTCQVMYYDYNDKESKFKQCELPSEVVIIPKTPRTSKNTLSLYVYYDFQVTQITISIPADIKKQQIFFCNYTTHNQHGYLLSGIGVLKKYTDIQKKIDEINTQKSVDDEIFNMLYEKSNNVFYNIDNSDELPNAADMEQLKDIAGIWTVYYLRSTKPESSIPDSNERGGVEQNYLKIEPSGKVYFRTDESKAEGYPGFLNYPMVDNRKLIKIKIYPTPKSRNYKINMFLNVNDEKSALEGVMSGWSSKGRPFSSPVRIEKVDRPDNTRDYFTTSRPRFFNRNEISSTLELSDSLLDFLRNKRKLLDAAENCLPPVPEGNSDFLKRLAGNFYLLSRDYQEAMLDKAKLKILESGEFTLQYLDVTYKGQVSEFISTNSPDKYIYLNIQFKRSHNTKWSKFSGGLLFNVPNTLFDNPENRLSKDSKETLTGLSLRKNVQGIIQAKKEVLIPVDNPEEFDKEKLKKYRYSDESGILRNLKTLDGLGALNVDSHKSLIKNLRGRENNIILLSQNGVLSMPKRETDYFEIYMDAFIFEMLFSKSIDYAKVYKYLFQSLLHLDDFNKLNDKIKDVFSKKAVQITSQNEIYEGLHFIYESMLNMGDSGELTAFLENLKAPNNIDNKSPILQSVNDIIQKCRNLL